MYTCVTGVSVFALRRPRDFTLPASRRETLYLYIKRFVFLRGEGLATSVFRLGLSMRFLKLEFVGQIASFEHRLQGAAPTPLTLPYPFNTMT